MGKIIRLPLNRCATPQEIFEELLGKGDKIKKVIVIASEEIEDGKCEAFRWMGGIEGYKTLGDFLWLLESSYPHLKNDILFPGDDEHE